MTMCHSRCHRHNHYHLLQLAFRSQSDRVVASKWNRPFRKLLYSLCRIGAISSLAKIEFRVEGNACIVTNLLHNEPAINCFDSWVRIESLLTFSLFLMVQNSGDSGRKNMTMVTTIGIINCTLAWSAQLKYFPNENEMMTPKLFDGSYNELRAPRTLKLVFC